MGIEMVKGCLLSAFDKGEVDIILHVVNCQGVFGAGLAKQIRSRYPEVYQRYMEHYNYYKSIDSQEQLLGDWCWAAVKQQFSLKYVINIFAQDMYGTDKRQLNYGALARVFCCLTDKHTEDCAIHKANKIGIPYGIGCGLAGGDFEIVLEMIEFFFKDHNVKIYQL